MRLSLLIATLLAAKLVHAEPPAPHAIRNDDAPLGSYVKRDAVKNIPVDPNKAYGDLSDSEKALLRSRYAGLGPKDEPPYPAQGMRPLLNAVHQAARKFEPEGKLSMYVSVDENGKATSVEVVNSPDAQLTRVVASILVLTPYKAAILSGKPAAMQFPFELNFTLEH